MRAHAMGVFRIPTTRGRVPHAFAVARAFVLITLYVPRADLSDPDARESTSFVESICQRPGRIPTRRPPNLNQTKALSLSHGAANLHASPPPWLFRPCIIALASFRPASEHSSVAVAQMLAVVAKNENWRTARSFRELGF